MCSFVFAGIILRYSKKYAKMFDRIPTVTLLSRVSLLLFILIPLCLLSYSTISQPISQLNNDTTTPIPDLVTGTDVIQEHRTSPIYKNIIHGDLETSDVIWNTTIPSTKAPFLFKNELRLAFVATNITNRFTEFKVRKGRINKQVALDSLFHHRECPVRLLFACDKESERWLTTYLKLRDFDEIKYSFYPHKVSDIVQETAENTGWRDGAAALLKLETHTLFPDVDDLILVDFDMIFTNDICESARVETERMKKEERILLVGNNMSPWFVLSSKARYQKTQENIGVTVPREFYPLNKGINTGTMFMNLSLMRRLKWTSIWIDELGSGRFSKEDYLHLPDQNIVNAIGIHSPKLIGFIGHAWNFQDLDRSNSARGRQLMLAMFPEINIFHGNNKYFATKLSSVMQLVWWMETYKNNVRPREMISRLGLTVDNYKDWVALIWLETETGGWK